MLDITNYKIKKCAYFSDIHWGKKQNDVGHNQDCLNFIDWFCENVKKDPEINTVAFLGDWFENRNAINVQTFDMAYQGARKLNALGVPVIFVEGNHDLYFRSNRAISSVRSYQEFDNFVMANEPITVDRTLFSPYLFGDEYDEMKKILKTVDIVAGHFEFRNFIITGYNTRMKHGADHTEFTGPKHIFSGHFHKRQAHDHVCYIGSAFPYDFSDANDTERGMMICDHQTFDVDFKDWVDCPKYIKIKYSKIGKNWNPGSNATVRCIVDKALSYSDKQLLREQMIEKFELRGFSFEEQSSDDKDNDDKDLEAIKIKSIDTVVVELLDQIEDTPSIDKKTLIEVYKGLKTDESKT